MAVKHLMEIEFEDGTRARVTVDQRDHVAAEEADFFPSSLNQVTRHRYLAWSAAKRAGETDLTWPKFNKQVVSADVVTDGGDEQLDPTQPIQPLAG